MVQGRAMAYILNSLQRKLLRYNTEFRLVSVLLFLVEYEAHQKNAALQI